MDSQKRTLIVTGLVLLIILAIIFVTVFYLIRVLTNRSKTTTQTKNIFPVASASPNATAFPQINIPATNGSPAPTPTPAANSATSSNTNPTYPNASTPITAATGDVKVYNGQGFTLSYPKSFGVLTCNNSQNFEFDPTMGADQLNAACDRAVKPITFLVGQSCSGGELITLGGTQVRKIKSENIVTRNGGAGTQYTWCTQTTPSLMITHRVGTGPAFSAQDFSKEVEQMIASFRLGGS